MWDPTLPKGIESLEMFQHSAVRFIAGLKGRESVTEACFQLGLQPLKQTQDSPTQSLHENFAGRTTIADDAKLRKYGNNH